MSKEANRQNDILRSLENFSGNESKTNLWKAIASEHRVNLILQQNRLDSCDRHWSNLNKLIKNYNKVLK